MQTVPRFLWGSFRIALKFALEEILGGHLETGTWVEASVLAAKNVAPQTSKRWPHQQGSVDSQVRQVRNWSMDRFAQHECEMR